MAFLSVRLPIVIAGDKLAVFALSLADYWLRKPPIIFLVHDFVPFLS